MNESNPARLMIYWDYDTQWGGDRSRAGQGRRDWGALEFPNTENLMEVHARYSIPACFAVVGAAAMPGDRPYHDPAQIRRIHAAGHEVGSHSFHHDWLPGLKPAEARRTLKSSKEALEQCIGHAVTSFVPPYNQPFHYPQRLAFSLSERREAGAGQLGLKQLCEALKETGYETCRVAYRPIWKQVAERLTGKRLTGPARVETIGGILCVPLNTPCGFDATARAMLDRSVQEGGLTVVYGHPHSLFTGGPQDMEHLGPFLKHAAGQIREGRLKAVLPRDLPGTGPELAKQVAGAVNA